MRYTIYGSKWGGWAADKARGEAECFIAQRDPHTECHKSCKALLAHFKWHRVTSANGRLVFCLPLSKCIICKPYLGHPIVSSVIQLVDSIQTCHAFRSEGRKGKASSVAAVGKRAPLVKRLSMNLNRTSPSCALFFISPWKNNYLLPLLLSLRLAS